MRIPCLLAIVLAAPAATAFAGEDPPATGKLKVESLHDLTYVKRGDVELKLDLAKPAESPGPFPAVLVIHGGAWRSGSKDSNRRLLDEFAARGFVAVSPQYRFCPKDLFPAQVHDVKSAVRWLRTHAGEHKTDPNRIGAMGFSAGGHLALMLGVTEPKDGLEGDAGDDAPSSRVQAVVNYFGPTDLLAEDIPDLSKPLVNDFLGGEAKAKADLAKQASPLSFVSPDDPPILTFQGTKDPLVPFTQAIKLNQAMTKAMVPGRVELLVGESHGWGGPELERTIDQTFRFFTEKLMSSTIKK